MTQRSRRTLWLGLSAVAMAAGTFWIGWWSVPVLALFMGLRCRSGDAAIAALLAWTGLLVWNATTGPILPYADRLGGIFGLPGWGMLLATPLFAALLGWSAATLPHSLRHGGT
ncbi:MAG TPA: hypothetical protein VGA78_18530 [Gemmatimonadales bacterium]